MTLLNDEAKAKIFRALGTASVCWTNPSGAGVFEAQEAEAVGNKLIAELEEAMKPTEPYLGLASTEQLMRELICRFNPGMVSDIGYSQGYKWGCTLSEILGQLPFSIREYRTVDY